MNAVVYEPFQHFIPTGMGWVKGLKGAGVNAFALPSTQYSLSDMDEDIDLVVIVGGVDPSKYADIIAYKKENPKVKICMCTLNFRPEYEVLVHYVDVWVETVLSHNQAVNDFAKRGLKLIFVPLAADDSRFTPTNDEKTYDVSFIGTMGAPGEREEEYYLMPVMDKTYKGFWGGFTYKGVPFPAIPHTSVNKVYNSTKVNLNFHYPYQKQEIIGNPLSRQDFNGRVYEIALSGNFQICDHPRVADIFEGGIPYVPKEKWMEAIDYYLTHEDERNTMAKIAREIALKDHTWKRRMEQFLKQI